MSIDLLPPRCRAVYRELIAGRSEKQIADVLYISPHTVHAHVKQIYRIAGVGSRAELLAAEIARCQRGAPGVLAEPYARIRIPRSLAHLIEIVDD